MQAKCNTVLLEQYILLTTVGTSKGPACLAAPRNEWFSCWVMSSFILTLSNHSLLTAVRKMNKCTAAFWLFSSVFSSYFIHTLSTLVGGSRTYLWLKLLSFRRQWRVTTLWPSLLTSWLTVQTTGLLALAPRNATPSFSLTLTQKNKRREKH